jgi:iron complex outermembrane receptor protein
MRSYHRRLDVRLLCGAGAAALLSMSGAAHAEVRQFELPSQPLGEALAKFGAQSDRTIVSTTELTRTRSSQAVSGAVEPEMALAQLLAGTGLSYRKEGEVFLIVQSGEGGSPQSVGAGGDDGNAVEALIVTAQKREENIQDVPIAMSAFSQETLTERQVAGGPDLITQIPNMTFTKTNFSSYSIQIRGIGTQAISATTDPAVAVAFNNTPFIRNRFFEQEFYDLERLEVLRGPQGTLYGRNATGGVVNLISAKPKFTYAAKLSGDLGNYNSRRVEGMVNIPLVDDVVALRLAGAWTKRDGYAMNQMTGKAIDGRDLWSTRLSLRFEPTDWISANLIWEHFEEDDDRLRSGKQLCKKDPTPTSINGVAVSPPGIAGAGNQQAYITQGCVRTSLYSPEAFQTPNGYSLPFYGPTVDLFNQVYPQLDPYLKATQSRDLRVIESSVEPDYRAKVDIAELQVSLDLTDELTLASETAYSSDFSWSLQDYNRFTTTPGAFRPSTTSNDKAGLVDAKGVFCDPQLGCSDRLLLVDLSTEESTQFSQEFRLGSDFDGPFNFSLGVNYLRHDAEAKYYVFINSLSMFAGITFPNSEPYVPGVDNAASCIANQTPFPAWSPGLVGDTAPFHDPLGDYGLPFGGNCIYIDPNPIGSLNDQGRNYFLSRNPYKLVSYAGFGEIYYNITDNFKLTAGLRFTVDRKTAPQIPSWLLAPFAAGEYPVAKTIFQEWREPTGRLALDWKPDLGFTDETLVYVSYAHGYKAGGANPPPPVLVTYGSGGLPTLQELLPDTFEPEFVDAFEVGTKNTLFDGAVTLNLTGFYYDYKGYQVSEIRNRSAVNSNYDTEVWGVEIEADWRPTEALKLGFKGGYNGTRIADGEQAIDLMDRTAGQEGWMVIRSFPTIPSNCIIPIFVLTAGGEINAGSRGTQHSACVQAYVMGADPGTNLPYVPNPTLWDPTGNGVAPLPSRFAGYPGWDPATAPNGGQGFSKELGGNELPNAPNYTATLTADYALPLSGDWLMNLHGDFHWQSESWWRVFQDHEYARLDAFSTVNLAAIFTNDDAGWKVMAYVKNVFDETALTGAFLNSDDTGLTTNVFLTEPRLYGLRVTKDFTGGGWLGEIGRCDDVCPVTVEVGGGVAQYGADTTTYTPAWLDRYNAEFPLSQGFQDRDLDWGDTRSVELTYAPSANWRVSAAYRFGKTNGLAKDAAYQHVEGGLNRVFEIFGCGCFKDLYIPASQPNHFRTAARDSEEFELAEFSVGREIGFGAFGAGGRSRLNAGLQHADLQSWSKISLDGVPTQFIPPITFPFDATQPQRTREVYTTGLTSEREFEGWGPSVSWDAAIRLAGNEVGGHVDLEWSVGAGALFGAQTTESLETRFGASEITSLGIQTTSLYDGAIPRRRTGDSTVPTLSLSLGLSYAIDRVKVSTGYSYDRFFDAIDGGWEDAQTFDRTIHGPYLKLSLGFGG